MRGGDVLHKRLIKRGARSGRYGVRCGHGGAAKLYAFGGKINLYGA